MITLKFSRLSLALGIALLPLAHAQAETKTSSFQVGMAVTASCAINATNLSFSSMPTGTTSTSDASTDISVSCSQGTPYQIGLSQGNNFSGGRRLASGGSFVNYELYSDPSRSNAWTSTQVVSFTGNGSAQSHTIFGRIPAGQSVPTTGSYADTIVATISY
ncbi:MAG: hypothetical protein RLY30_1041 [Pseudomonadota bacterium]